MRGTVMPKTTRKVLLEKAEQALNCIDRLDLYLMDMDLIHGGRQPAIDQMKKTLVQGHEQIRVLWKILQSQL